MWAAFHECHPMWKFRSTNHMMSCTLTKICQRYWQLFFKLLGQLNFHYQLYMAQILTYLLGSWFLQRKSWITLKQNCFLLMYMCLRNFVCVDSSFFTLFFSLLSACVEFVIKGKLAYTIRVLSKKHYIIQLRKWC